MKPAINHLVSELRCTTEVEEFVIRTNITTGDRTAEIILPAHDYDAAQRWLYDTGFEGHVLAGPFTKLCIPVSTEF